MDKIKKTDHFYLIDGSGYIFRAYYALPPLTRKSDGLPVGAVSGFCSMLFKLLEDSKSNENLQKPTHFAVIFDAARKTFRNEIYSDYKANRSEAPDDLAPQFEYIRKSVVAFNLPSVDLPNYEADDLIATYVEQILAKGAKVTIVSSDKDLMQLYRKDVRIFDPMKNKFITPEDIVTKFGVGPEKVIDVQSLAGDSSDNVPGVPGIGVKTAAELINKYGTLEKLLDNAQEIKQNKRRETLIENKDKAIISKKLVTLMKDAPVERKLEEFHLKEIDKDKLYKFLREMEFNRLLSSVISAYGEPLLEETAKETKPEKKHQNISKKNYHLITNEKEIDEWINEAEEAGELAIDTETSSLDAHQTDLVGISLSTKIGKACYIPIGHKFKGCLKKETVIKKLKPLLEDKSVKKIGQNIKFDFIVLYKHGINMNSMEDTMLMSYVLDAGKNRHNMDTLSEIHLQHKTISFKEIVGTGKKEINFSDVELDKAMEYAAEDADITYRLYKIFSKNLKLEKLTNIYEIFEKPLIKILAFMEIEGIKIDNKFLKVLSEKFEKKISKLEKEVFKISKKEFNIASPKQLGEIIYNDLKIAVLKKTRKGSFATNASVLEDLAFKGHEFPKLILDWRQVSKLKNTYSDALPEHINPNTKRVHTSFLLAATTTGRLASSDPNLQNIPIKSEDGKDIRKAFIAEKGFTLISADYNQIEMRILADLAEVKELKKAFSNNEDIHSLTASQVFNVDIKKVDQDMRRKAKAINFGIIYGISQYGLAKQINVSNHEADEFLNAYFLKFPEIKIYMDNTIKFCRKSGYVTNIFGRRSHFNGINDKNFNVRNFQERAAINAPIQGSASEIMRLAMIRLNKKFESIKNNKSKILLQIHDELIFEVPVKEVKNITEIIKDEMTSVTESDLHTFSTPLTVDVNTGDNWGILH
ncbi:DNA polymerase I [Candidatus Pelagibacter ubique]|uniref:DNA polymerase I n=1 Tax=Pelagibacter ubique TaxID=198252 RepID=UPI00037AB9D4|nr:MULTISPECIES: DNA polymerase I [Pelagibacter]MDA9158896.1 DNA polymerase I [Candidatus Pelagibacter ubique]MDA8834310.1 DNA polymerase I [Candidatus Pelagibacter bacterium]MDA9217234.1 DNA polymerase I [Candidatus Pelagibacter ubique]MDB0029526.1 DNA polymerase I [Candidatus Pelagibacter ubique]MDC0372422.1 DNA polymerase I [Candidatus Pelagibacter ubique]